MFFTGERASFTPNNPLRMQFDKFYFILLESNIKIVFLSLEMSYFLLADLESF